MKAVRKENYSSEFDFVNRFYESDLNVHALEMQLQIVLLLISPWKVRIQLSKIS